MRKMNEAYYEVMVTRKGSPMMKVVQIVTALLAGVFAVAMVMGFVWGILLATAFGIACYVVTMISVVEYEYLYVDKELQIDRILGKSRRKRMETLDLNELELLAPLRSHELDRYRNDNYKKTDYSSGKEENEQAKYIMIIHNRQIVFEPTEELVKTIRMFAPRKVFTY